MNLYVDLHVFLLVIFLVSFRATATGNESQTEGRNLSILLLHTYFPSHCFPLIALGAELVNRGHKVSVLGSVLQDYQFIPRLAESHGMQYIDKVLVPNEIYDGFREVGKHEGDTNFISVFYNMSSFYASFKNYESDVTKIRKIIDTLNGSEYDYIIAEQAISFILPYIWEHWNTTNTMGLLVLLDLVPRYVIPWPYPRYFSPLPENMSFTDRFLNTLVYTPMESIILYLVTSMVSLADSKLSLPCDFLSFSLYQPNLYNTVIGVLEWPRNILPLQHYIGPMFLSNPTPLNNELLQWIEKGNGETIVYISMGTTALITTEIAQAILSLSTQYRLIWSLRESNNDILKGLFIDSNQVYMSSWVSQFTLLQHPTVQLAILHCGLNGVQESLYNKVPVLCVPYGMDQHDVAFKLSHQQFGLSLLPHELNVQNLKQSLQTLRYPLYQKRVSIASHLLKAGGGVKKGADLVELYAVIGYQHGIPSFISQQWNSVQYYNIDVWLVIVSLLIGTILMCNKYCHCCKRCQCKKVSKTKKE